MINVEEGKERLQWPEGLRKPGEHTPQNQLGRAHGGTQKLK